MGLVYFSVTVTGVSEVYGPGNFGFRVFLGFGVRPSSVFFKLAILRVWNLGYLGSRVSSGDLWSGLSRVS